MAKFVKTKNEIKDIYGLISTYHSTGHQKKAFGNTGAFQTGKGTQVFPQ